MSVPKGSDNDQVIPEDVGNLAAQKLLTEIYRVLFVIKIIKIFSFFTVLVILNIKLLRERSPII